MEKDKLAISKSENKISHVRMYSETKSSKALNNDSIFKKLKTPSKEEEVDQNILISINGHHNEVNYYSKK
jgi:hypothetical protein